MSRYIKKNAILVFRDGLVFQGTGIGKRGQKIAEICFNTSLTGYQEILSDPSYKGQIINFTFPHIGNVGINLDDIESLKPQVAGLVIHDNITNPANFRSTDNLNDWLIKHDLTGICGVDTRKITQIIRENGGQNVAIIYQDDINSINIDQIVESLKKSKDLKGVELASQASLNKNYNWQEQGCWNHNKNSYNQNNKNHKKIVAIDYGAKLHILRCLKEVGFDVEIVGANATLEDILSHNPDGIFLSNGPGDPAQTAKYAAPIITQIIKKDIPLFGICLGHQLLSLAMGAKTIKMEQGHRGANHPVQDLRTGKVEITSQNHGFCVDKETLPDNLEITHISLFDQTIEGIKVKDKKAFSVQYHPESSPGPIDSFYLFEEFANMVLGQS